MSEPSSGGLFDGVLARGSVREAVSDRAWLQAMLDVEAGLARAEARAGLFPVEVAEAIARACRADALDLAAIGRDASASGNPVVPLVRAITAAVDDAAAAGEVHRGATSQDILDSAAMLVARRAIGSLLEDVDAAADAAAALADAHRGTLIAGRTLLQHAVPTTFGLKAAGWTAGLDQGAVRLDQVRRTRLAVQLGGAAGTLASLGDRGPAVVRHLAEDLGLAEPVLPWHTDRTRVADLAGALGGTAGACAKPAQDVVLLSQMERNGVDHAVLIQMAGQANNAYQFACVKNHPGRFANVVIVDTNQPEAPGVLEQLAPGEDTRRHARQLLRRAAEIAVDRYVRYGQ